MHRKMQHEHPTQLIETSNLRTEYDEQSLVQ